MATTKQLQDKQKYIDAAHVAEQKYGIPKNTLVGLLGAESNFNPNAVSPAGARGIAQFMKGTAKEYGIDPLNPFQSIDAAGKYLASSYKKFGNWEDSLRSYNLGVGGVQAWKAGKRPLPKETQDYVGRVYKKAGINYSDPSYANNVQPYIKQNQEITIPTISNFDVSAQSPTFVPEEKEETAQTDKNIQELQQKSNEKSFLEELYTQEQPQYAESQEEVPQQIPKTNFANVYNQVSQFIDLPVAQQGGNFTENELAFLSEIAIKDNNGYWNPNNQGKVVEIEGGNITMKGVDQELIGISKETGETKNMLPNKEYKFAKTKNVLEIPKK